MIITIDGPTASGKSSTAKELAQKLGYYHLNSGMLYRATTYILMHLFNYTNETLIHVSDQDLAQCTDHKRLIYHYDSAHEVSISYDNTNITMYLKDAEIDQAVCLISPLPHVRAALTTFQRKLAAHYDVVTDGRDTGSVVFPNANYKFYLTASLEVRARRWQQDQQKRGHFYTLEECKERVEFRDAKDRERDTSPLIIPQDALVVDNSNLDKKQTLQLLLDVIKK